jgi:Tol biopolymer transport system component
MRRIILVCAAAGLVGCGKETFETPPDCSGRYAVAYARQPAADQADVYLYDFEGQGFHLLPSLNSTSEQDLDPTMTRDLRFIAFERVTPLTTADILLYDRCQASLLAQPGLNSGLDDKDPAFSGDGQKLAFVRDTLGREEVRLYDGVNARLVPLPGLATAGSYHDADPAPNQDGSLIAFASNRSGNADILVYDASGDSLLDLPDLASPGSDLDPSITPDGRYLAFCSDRVNAGDYDLFLYDLQTKQFLALAPGVNTGQIERRPSISQDAQRIVFESSRVGSQGILDLYLYTRSTATITNAGASSATPDTQPWIVWQ